MLVTAKDILRDARKKHYAIGQFNINNLEWTMAILKTAEKEKSPVILGVTEAALKHMAGFNTVAAMVKGMLVDMEITVPTVLHLDHASYDACIQGIEAGFTSVMFDGSKMEIDENIYYTKKLLKKCMSSNVSLEVELGSIAGEEDGIAGKGELASLEQCKQMADIGVTMLAAGIGNIHGVYPENWKGLDFDLLERIGSIDEELPLVLHGGTGISVDNIQRAINLGISKINVNTECQLAFVDATRHYIINDMDKINRGFEPRKFFEPGSEAISDIVKQKIRSFGSFDRV